MIGHLSDLTLALTSSPVLDSVTRFLLRLDANLIDATALEFEHSLPILSEQMPMTTFGDTQAKCSDVLRSAQHDPLSIETAKCVSGFWSFQDTMSKFVLTSAICTRATRAVFMASSWSIYNWITKTVSDMFESPSEENWMGKLMISITKFADSSHTNMPERSVKLLRSEFMPEMSSDSESEFTFKIPRTTKDLSLRRKRIIHIVCSVACHWLNFPNDDASITKFTLLSILLSCNNPAVLYFDPVWEMYMSPYTHVIHIPRTSQRKRPEHTQKTIEKFAREFANHPFMREDSNERAQLGHLLLLIQSCGASVTKAAFNFPYADDTNIPQGTLLSDEEWNERKMGIFVRFLRQLYPLATTGFPQFIKSRQTILSKVAKNPDRLLPFRSLAPCWTKAASTIYVDKERLKTDVGFFNMLAFRGCFYNSQYARDDLQYLDDITDYENLVFALERKATAPDNKAIERYFVNQNAYGVYQGERETKLLYRYWADRNKWSAHQRQENPFDPRSLFQFFQGFHNVGSLTALLLVGDLVECGFIPEPDVRIMGELVVQVEKGALHCLQKLGLVRPGASKAAVVDAFESLHHHVIAHTTPEFRTTIGYNVIMLEHALCKMKRLNPKKAAASTQTASQEAPTKRRKKKRR